MPKVVGWNDRLDFSSRVTLLTGDVKLSLRLLLRQRLHPTEDGEQNLQLHDRVALYLLINEFLLRIG